MVTPVWGKQLSVPHKFSPGTPAKASEVNENFEAVEDAINNLLSKPSLVSTLAAFCEELNAIPPHSHAPPESKT